MTPTINNWKEYVETNKEDSVLLGFLKHKELMGVKTIHSGADSKERLSMAPEGLDFDYVLILSSCKWGVNRIQGHEKDQSRPENGHGWLTFDSSTFEII